ncbi:hypothetical protein [Corynebacterium rhinophilum]|uniref:hypothetical protein n=1 Tax=Corynebacterium rhinophilum TaxID=3050197 RepID=UPI00254A07BC|nr:MULTISPECIES: hypothetical protein [unclassified Corynebacterium]MDK8466945.1 hypothetical protein [Corynebacterium sp. MSK130]MDK8687567.1 hypothetical protein [Corynebacterium sp. MSK122]
MSNQDRAAKVIDRHGFDPCREPECIAQDLADAGLLAPDLPEPSNIIEEDEEGGDKRICWSAPGCDIELVPGKMIVTYEHQAGHEIEHAQQIGLALLAAANYQEEA